MIELMNSVYSKKLLKVILTVGWVLYCLALSYGYVSFLSGALAYAATAEISFDLIIIVLLIIGYLYLQWYLLFRWGVRNIWLSSRSHVTALVSINLLLLSLLVVTVFCFFMPTLHLGKGRDPIDLHAPGLIDEIRANLQHGQIAFNTPEEMELKETTKIELYLSLKESIEELKKKIKSPGKKESYPVEVSSVMRAILNGNGFKIKPITLEEQAVSDKDVTRWSWQITALEPGQQTLHLTIYAILFLDKMNVPREIKTFEKEITVRVSWNKRIMWFLKNNWQWLWTVILVPLAGWFWKKRKISQKG